MRRTHQGAKSEGRSAVREAVGAVVDRTGGRIRIEPIEIDPPGPGEVLVRLGASGICHSDHWAIRHGNWGAPFPMLLGHEGAGVVEEVGADIDAPAPGDPVILAWAVPCGTCMLCRRGEPRRCSHEWTQPPRLRIPRTGAPLAGTLSLGTLATHTVVHAAQAIPVSSNAALERVCLLGCGVSTGLGAAINTARVRPGASVAVLGLGGIGLSAVQGARVAGASRIVAIDLVAWKLEVAHDLGATDVIDASSRDPVAAVRELSGGVDVAIEATGRAEVVGQAVAMLSRGGVACAVGVPEPDSDLTIAWGDGRQGAAYPNKATLVITDGGDPLPDEDFPRWVGWSLDGRLDLDAMVSREIELSEADLTDAFRAMLAGEVIRTVVRIDER
jgi:S-(hydroxymethyl)mycothiol dehydrogenase